MPLIDTKLLLILILKTLGTFWYVWAFLLALALGKIIYRLYEMKRLARSGVNEIDKMDGKTFEKYLEVLFNKLGYKVERTRYIGDYGADLVVKKEGIKTVIQAKRYKNKVNIKAIQEAVAAMGHYQCEKAMVVTNSFYTKQAIELARSNRVELWDRKHLVKALLSIKGKPEAQTNLEASATTDTIEPTLQHEVDNDKCIICGQAVSEKVKQYCLDHNDRFGGKVYCFQHQKGVK